MSIHARKASWFRVVARWATLLTALVLCSALPANALAQRSLAVEGEMAGSLSPAPVQRRNVTLLNDPAQGEVPVLFNDRAQGSLAFSLRVIASALEVGYTLDSIRLGRGIARCRGTGAAFVLANGSIDDSAVRYDCDVERFPIDGLSRPVSNMNVHHLGGGLRFYPTGRSVLRGERESQGVQLYAVLGGGFSLSNYAYDIQQRSWRPGFHVLAGAGFDVPLGRSLTFTLSARYRVVVLTTSLPSPAAAARAEDSDVSVVGSMFEPLHLFTLGAGLRFSFR
jgi:hypothetical protein